MLRDVRSHKLTMRVRKEAEGLPLPLKDEVKITLGKEELNSLISKSYAHFEKGNVVKGLGLIRQAQARHPLEIPHVRANEIAREETRYAKRVALALKTIQQIRRKYPKNQRSVLGVQFPEKRDCQKLYKSHHNVASCFTPLFWRFGVWLEDCSPAYSHDRAAKSLKVYNRVLQVAERRKEVADKLASMGPSTNDPEWHVLKGALADIDHSEPDAIRHYAEALRLCSGDSRVVDILSKMRRQSEYSTVQEAVKTLTPKGEDPEKFSWNVLLAHERGTLKKAPREVEWRYADD